MFTKTNFKLSSTIQSGLELHYLSKISGHRAIRKYFFTVCLSHRKIMLQLSEHAYYLKTITKIRHYAVIEILWYKH